MKRMHSFRSALTLSAVGLIVAGAATLVDAQNRAENPAKNPAPDQPAAQQPSSAATNPSASDRQQPAGENQAGRQDSMAKPSGLGIQFETKASSGRGLEIANIDPNSPAAQAGLQPRDRVISVDGRPFAHRRHVMAYLSAQAGRPVPLVIERNGQQQTLQIVPGRSEADSGWLGILLFEDNQNRFNAQNAQEAQPNAPAGNQNTPGNEAARGSASQLQNNGQNAAGPIGARVAQVYPNSPAARAGLRPGDLITQINGTKIDDTAELVALVHEMKPQTKAEFDVMRDNQVQKIPVTIGSRNSEYAESQYGPNPDQFGQGPNGPEQWGQFGPGQFGRGPMGPPPGQFGQGQFGQGQFAPGQVNQGQWGPQQGQDFNSMQRLEEEVRQLRQEVRQLREQLQKK